MPADIADVIELMERGERVREGGGEKEKGDRSPGHITRHLSFLLSAGDISDA